MTQKSDIQRTGWITNVPKAMQPYLILMRADRPIGTWLLLFPCWWSVLLASEGRPDWLMLLLFAAGSFIMRGAGCVMNDLADRNLDGQVARTKTRPIPNGDVTPKQAVIFMGFLCLLGLGILLNFNVFSIYLGAGSLLLVFLYPFCKRFTYWPQVVLGLTFNWGALLGWAAVTGTLSPAAFCLYAAGLFWTLGYDTIYAHQDKEDDVMVGIKSTALKLGNKTKPALWLFYGLCLACLLLAGSLMQLSAYYYMGLGAVALHFTYQIAHLNINDPARCLKLFKANSQIGWLVLGSLILGTI